MAKLTSKFDGTKTNGKGTMTDESGTTFFYTSGNLRLLKAPLIYITITDNRPQLETTYRHIH